MSDSADRNEGRAGSEQREGRSPAPERRRFLAQTAMAGGLVAGYGLFAAHAARYLYGPTSHPRHWQYAARVEDLKPGESREFEAADGSTVALTRMGEGETEEDFVALSNVCPHLGCIVHWEAQNDRYFCPCHNGTFDRFGRPTGGPPKADDTPLTRFDLKIEGGLVYIDVPPRTLASNVEQLDRPRRAGIDPCLFARPRRSDDEVV